MKYWFGRGGLVHVGRCSDAEPATHDRFVLTVAGVVARLRDPPRLPASHALYLAFHDEEIGRTHGAAAIAALLKSRGVRAELWLDEGGSIIQGESQA